MKKIYTIVWIIFLISFESKAIIYASYSGAGSKDGSSWSNAYDRFQLPQAILNAPMISQIWVAEGIYKPTYDGDRNKSFHIGLHVKLYGGFVGNETDISQRNLSVHSTIFSGDLSENDSPSEIRYDHASRSENSIHILKFYQVDMSYGLIDGITFSGGNANISGDLETMSGGVFNILQIPTAVENIGVAMRNCVLKKNTSLNGGAIAMRNLHSTAQVELKLENCVLDSNTAEQGGAVYFFSNSYDERNEVRLLSTSFSNNYSSQLGGAISINSYFDFYFFIKKSTFSNNTSSDKAAALNLSGTGSNTFFYTEIDSTEFSGNQSVKSGAIGVSSGNTRVFDIRFLNSVFIQNKAISNTVFEGSGGVLDFSSFGKYDRVYFENCQFNENEARYKGSILNIYSPYNVYGGDYGAAFYKCKIKNNLSNAGLFNSETTENNSGRMVFTECEVSDNVFNPVGNIWSFGINILAYSSSNQTLAMYRCKYNNNPMGINLDAQNNSVLNYQINDSQILNNDNPISVYSYSGATTNGTLTRSRISNPSSSALNLLYSSDSKNYLNLNNSAIYNNLRAAIFCLTNDNALSEITIENSTIANNYNFGYGSVTLSKSSFSSINKLNLKNSILAGNKENYGSIEYNLNYNGVFAGELSAEFSNITQGSNPYPGVGNINKTAGFIMDDSLYLQLSPFSPCINAGSNAYVLPFDKDLIQNPRINGQNVDMGAFEYNNCTPIRKISINTPLNSVTSVKASDKIISDKTIDAESNILFDSKNSILLNPGFEAKKGAVFATQLTGCQ